MSIARRVPAGSRRFWVTVVCFAIANCAAWVVYDRVIQPRRHPVLNVLQFDPGDGSNVSSRPTLSWNFNLDVAASAPDAPAPGQISPPVAGRWQWKDARTLTFEPSADLPAATPFTISLGTDRLRTPEGFRLAKPFVCSIHTDPLSVQSVTQSAFDEADHLVLAIKFSDKVIPADLLQHLTISGSDGKSVKFHLHGEATAGTLHVMTDPVGRLTNQAHAFVQVHISPGLAGSSGPLGLAQEFSAQVAVTSDLQSEAASASAPAAEEPYISVNFNNPVDLSALREVISVEPAANISISSDYGSSAVLRGGLQPGTRYAIKIAKAPAHSGTRQYPAPTTLSVFIPDRSPGVWLEHTEGYLSSAGNRTVKAHAVNVQDLKVSVSRVYENNIVVWRNASSQRMWRAMDPYGRPLADRQIHLPLEKNKVQDISLAIDDLLPADAMRDGVYQIDISSRATDAGGVRDLGADGRDEVDYSTLRVSSMVTLSDIGITAKQGRTAVNVWATSLRTAKPLQNVRMRLYSNKNQPIGEAVTNADGLARIANSQTGPGETPTVILADLAPAEGTDSSSGLTWLDLSSGAITFADSDTSGRPYLRSGYEAFVYTDRGVYRPGETVHLRAILRGADNAMPAGQFPVRWQIRRPDLRNWKGQDATIDADGATSFDLQLPADLPTGQWSAHVCLPDSGPSPRLFGSVFFQVEEFMPNRMKIALDVDDDTPSSSTAAKGAAERILIGDKPLVARIQADYLFGRPVTERPAALVARADPIPFSPPQWQGWSIGDAIGSGELLGKAKPIGHRNELPESELDDKGRTRWDVNIAELIENGEPPASVPVVPRRRFSNRRTRSAPAAPAANTGPTEYAGPWRVTLSGSVTETGGRAVTATRQIDVDLIPSYIAVRQQQTAVLPNTPAAFDVALVKPDGSVSVLATAIEAELFQETWNESLILDQGLYHFQSTRVLERASKDAPITVSLRDGRGLCTVTPPASGSFVLRLRDPATGFVSACEFYVGDRYWNDNISRENPEKLELIVEPLIPSAVRETWNSLAALVPWPEVRDWLQVGGASGGPVAPDQRDRVQDWARVIVRSPFAGKLLLSVETDDVLTTRVIDMPASNMIVPIRLPKGCKPNAYVTASVVRPVEPGAAWRTHRAVGVARLLVDTSDERLNVQVAAPDEIRPFQSLPVRLRITDAIGNPVPHAAVTVAAVDEGICQLTGFATPDPFAYFTEFRALGVGSSDLYSQLMPETERPAKTSSVGGDGGEALDSRHRSPVSTNRVKPVALFSGVVHTDEAGLASADFPVPSFTGQLRVMAIASAESGFGSSSVPVLVRSPLLVQSSWPRFAAPGDRFTVPLTIFNNSRADGQAAISVQWIDEAGGAGPIRFANTKESRLDLPPSQIRAGGQVVVNFDVIAAEKIGVAHVRLTGEMNGERYEETVELPVRPPSPEVTLGGYAAATSASATKISLPGGMLEGTARYEVRVSPWPTLQLPQGLDYLDHYPYGCVEQTTSTLFPLVYLPDIGAQIAPGLFDKDRINEKVQVGITRLIGMQTADGGLAMWPGGSEAWPWASVYAAHFLVEAKNAGYEVPDEFREHLLRYVHSLLRVTGDEPENLETQAYACYVLALSGKPERPSMSRLDETLRNSQKQNENSSQARFHLAAAWLAAGRRDLGAAMIPQTLPAPREDRQLSGNIDSPIRERAVLLSTLLAVEPDHPEIPELARQLADAGRSGKWQSTQEIAFAVMALGQYLRQAQSVEPYQTADLLLGGQSIASAADGKTIVWQAPPGFDPATQPLELRITGNEKTKAYATWLQTGVGPRPPADSDHSLKVRRRYLSSHGGPIRNGVVRSGDLVIVELSIESTSSLDNVVIEDLFPAGLEVENPRLLTTDAEAAKEDAPADDKALVFEDGRLDIKDDRLIVVGHLNSTGVGKYRYAARAVTSGVFVTPPVRAECMYDVGTSSVSGGGGTLKVLPVDAARVVDTGKD